MIEGTGFSGVEIVFQATCLDVLWRINIRNQVKRRYSVLRVMRCLIYLQFLRVGVFERYTTLGDSGAIRVLNAYTACTRREEN
jgi:hypothetical protein